MVHNTNDSSGPARALLKKADHAPLPPTYTVNGLPEHAPIPMTYTVNGAMAATGLGRSTIFQCMADGRLARIKVGKRTLIPRKSLESLLFGCGE